MVFQWTFNDLRGLSRFLADLSVVFVVSVVSKTFWNGSKQSFSGLSGKWSFSSLSAISQWTFKGLISLSMIFRQSLLSRFFRILAAVSVSLLEFSRGSWSVFQWSRSVFQRSWLIFQRSLAVCQMIFQWSLNGLIGLSVNFQLSSRSYGDLAGKVVFGLSMVFQGFSEPFHRDSKFHWSWRLLTDLANIRSFSGLSRVSVLWNGGPIFAKWRETWISLGSYGIFVAITGSAWLLRSLRGSGPTGYFPRKPRNSHVYRYCRVDPVTATRWPRPTPFRENHLLGF